MTADSDRAVLDAAWGHISQTRGGTVGLGSFTRQRIDRSIALVAGIGTLALSAQTFVATLGERDEMPQWRVPLLLLAFIPLLVMAIACLIGKGVRIAAGSFAILFVVVLALWPIATAGSHPDPGAAPWVYLLLNISTLAAVLSFPFPLQVVWTLAIPPLYGLVRAIQGGFDVRFWGPLAFDVSFALILGCVLLVLGWVLRSVAQNVDETRARAVESYAAAAAAAAAEQERFAVSALMHDSVLAALISTERAQSARERTLAVAMAREALTRLANAEQEAGEGSDDPRSVDWLADEVQRAVRELGIPLLVERDIDGGVPLLPGRVARALILAATQAMANALQHAAARGLRVSVQASPPTSPDDSSSVRIVVADSGPGFDCAAVPEDRLGIRGSIVARVAAIGGSARIDSGGSGTTVSLEWENPRS